MGDVCGDRGVLCNRYICALVNLFRLMGVCDVFLTGLICIGILGHFVNNYGHDDNEHQF